MAAAASGGGKPGGTPGGPKRPSEGSVPADRQLKKISRRERRQKDVKTASEPPPTKIIQTDAANFRMLVQELTSGTSKARSRGRSPGPSPAASASPAPSTVSAQSSPPLQSSSHPPSSKTNQRLRSLAPPPIRPTAVNATAVGFRPVLPRSSTPGSQSSSLPASDSGDTASGLGTSRGLAQFPFGMAGSPYPIFSPHFLSPVALLSPRDMFCAGHIDSPGSMAMREMAMMAMAQALGSREASGLSTPRPESLPASTSMSAAPPPHLHPMLHPGYGMFPAFAAGFAIGPAIASSIAVPGPQIGPAAPGASPGAVHPDTPTSVQYFGGPS